MQPYVITVAQQKGGVGKSTLACHFATAFTKLGAKTAIIDTDPQQTIINWSKIRAKNSSSNKLDINISSSNGWKVSNEISKLYKFDIVIIDSSPHMETETKSAIRAANLVIVPCQPSPNDLWATESTLEIIKKEKKNMILILNRCSHNSKLQKQIESHFAGDIEKYSISNRVAFATAMISGLTIVETEPNSLITNEILQITRTLYDNIQK